MPLLPVQILWVNVVTDALPAFALAVSSGDSRSMYRHPKGADDHPLNRKGLIWVFGASVIVATLTLLAYLAYHDSDINVARTAAFTVLIVTQMIMAGIIAYIHRGKTFNWYANRWLLMAVLGTILIQGLLLLIPGLRQIFHLTALF